MLTRIFDFFRKQEKAETPEQLALKKINTEMKGIKKRDKKADKARIAKLKEIENDFTKNKYNKDAQDILIAIRDLAENLEKYIKDGYQMMKSDPAAQHLLNIKGFPLHIEYYSPGYSNYSGVDLISALNEIVNSFIRQYDQAKQNDLVEDWSRKFDGYCLDGRLESSRTYFKT